MGLPGTVLRLEAGAKCDDHEDVDAVACIQGETDSMGYESLHMCQECYDQYKEAEKTRDTSGCCEWCKTQQPKLRHHRDSEEGMHGPVYLVCDGCIKRESDQLAEELGEDDNDRFGDDDYRHTDDEDEIPPTPLVFRTEAEMESLVSEERMKMLSSNIGQPVTTFSDMFKPFPDIANAEPKEGLVLQVASTKPAAAWPFPTKK